MFLLCWTPSHEPLELHLLLQVAADELLLTPLSHSSSLTVPRFTSQVTVAADELLLKSPEAVHAVDQGAVVKQTKSWMSPRG